MNVARVRQVGAYIAKSVTITLTVVALLLMFSLVQSKLAGREPAIAGCKIYIVMSGSMEPAIKVGSMVAVRPLEPEEVQPGDIITFRSERGSTVATHRVSRVDTENGLLFYTKGDANDIEDPSPVDPRNLVGKVVLTVPHLGYMFAYARTARCRSFVWRGVCWRGAYTTTWLARNTVTSGRGDECHFASESQSIGLRQRMDCRQSDGLVW